MLLEVAYVLNPGIIVIAFLFSAAVGVIFRVFPARAAARPHAIAAW
jgi:putative ABC transport system permease protein